jgi:phytoene dehydrogenase-like protein
MVFADGSSLLLTRMVADTKDSIGKFSWKDANAFGRIIRKWKRMVNEIVGPLTYMPAMSPMDLSIALEKTEVGRELLETAESSPLEIINDAFEDDRVRTLLLYVSCMWGLDPRESGVGLFVPLLIDRGMNKSYCYGGSHKLAGALEREIIRGKGMVLEAAEVTNIIMENGHVAGVELAEGRTLRSNVVISSLDPHTTFLDLVGRDNLPGTLQEAVEGWVYDKWSFNTLHVASEEPPQYKCDDPWVNEAFMTIFGIESFDPHMTRKPGQHVSFFQMHAPYEIEGGWERRGKELEEAILAKWQKAAPNFTREQVINTNLETPEDIEIRFPNMRRGSIKHGDYRPTQLNTFRPNVDCSGHKTPVEGLYVCGVSTYPGGLVLGGSGYLAANRVADDMGVTKWWKPTTEMERFTKTYME